MESYGWGASSCPLLRYTSYSRTMYVSFSQHVMYVSFSQHFEKRNCCHCDVEKDISAIKVFWLLGLFPMVEVDNRKIALQTRTLKSIKIMVAWSMYIVHTQHNTS